MSSLTDALEAGRRAHEQSVELAYQRSRRAVTDPLEDQEAALKLKADQLNTDNLPTAIAQKNEAARLANEEAAQTNDFSNTNRVYQRAGQYLGAVANQLDANPNAKPSDILKTTPPEVLKAVHLDTPDAQAHFAEVYDADPSLVRAHAQQYGAGRKVTKSEFVTKDGTPGFLQTFEGEDQPHFTPGYKKQITGGGYTIAGKRYDSQGNLITDDSEALAALEGAKAANRAVGAAQGKTTAEDIAPSDKATRDAGNAFLDIRNNDKAFQDAGTQALNQISQLSAGYGANSSKIAGTPAYQLAQSLKTMQAQLTLGALTDLKKASKSGASGLGALSDKEGALLAALQGSLDSGQDPKVLAHQINELKAVHAQRLIAQEKAFQDNYGMTPEAALSKGSRAPAAATPDQSVFDAKTQALLDKYK